jgi:hypothetical protein
MLDRINQSKTYLKMQELEEEVSLSEDNYLTKRRMENCSISLWEHSNNLHYRKKIIQPQ